MLFFHLKDKRRLTLSISYCTVGCYFGPFQCSHLTQISYRGVNTDLPLARYGDLQYGVRPAGDQVSRLGPKAIG